MNEKFPPIEIFEFSDPGLRADPTKPHLLTHNVTKKHLSPYIGTELKGVQISQLGKEGLDELALFVAERKLVVFRDQDFKDLTPERQIEIARYVSYYSLLCIPLTHCSFLQAFWAYSEASYFRKRQGFP